jgi:hypothetical protein
MIQDRLTLKSYFITGASPDEADFGNLIDSTLLVEDIVTSLTSTSTTDPLAASLGKVLNDSIVALTSRVVSLEGEEADFASNYYNKTEVDTRFSTTDGLLDGLVLANYQSQIDSLQGQIDNIDTTGSPAGIEISNVSGLQSALDVKASISELNSVRDSLIASIGAIDTSGGSVDLSGVNSSIATLNDEIDALEVQLANKASSSHVHSDIYTKTEVDTLITNIDTSDHTHVAADITDLGSEIQAKTNLLVADHSDLTNNPHSVTKAQVGLGKVENLTPFEIVSLAGGVTQFEIDDIQTQLDFHKLQPNPHGTTKEDLGLGDVPNLNPQALLDQHLNEDNPHGIDLTYFDVYAKAEADTRTQFYIDSLRYAFTPLNNSDSAGATGDFAYDSSNLYFKNNATSWVKIPFLPVYISREATQEDVDAGLATEVGEIIEVNEVELPQVTNINVTENFNITNQAGDNVINLTEEGDVRLTSTIVENVTIEGDTIVNENISSSTETVTIQDNTVIEGDTTIEQKLFVKNEGDTVFKVTEEGDTTIAGATTINKSLNVTNEGDTIFEVTEDGDVNIGGDTNVSNFTSTGSTTINENLYSSTGDFNIQGDTIVSGTLEATEIKVSNVFEVRTNIDGSKYLYAPSIVSENISTGDASLKEIDTHEIEFWQAHKFAGVGNTITSVPESVKLKASYGVINRLTLQQDTTTRSLAFIEDLSAYALKTDLDGLGGTGSGGGDGSSGETGTDLVLDGTTGGAESGYAYEEGSGFYAIDYGPDETEGTADDVQSEYWSTQVSAISSTGLVINLGDGVNNPFLRYDTQLSRWGFSNGGGVSYDLSDSYSKTESDGRYEPLDSAYTKAESDSRYPQSGTSYTKNETDNLLSNYPLKSRVAMTSGVAGATDIVIEGRYNNNNVATGISINDGTGDNPYIRFDPSSGDWVAYDGNRLVTIGAVTNVTNVTNEGDTIINEGDTVIQSGLTLDASEGGAESGYAYQEYSGEGELYADDPGEAGDQEYWNQVSESIVSRGLTIDIGLESNPSVIYDVSLNNWVVNNGTGYGTPFELNDSYTKGEADSRYEPIDSAYTKAESNQRYALLGTSYSKTETDNLITPFALKTRVAMTSGVAGATDIVINGRYNNAAVPTGISVDDGTNDMPYIRFDPSAGDWVAYNGSDVVTIGAVVNNITNEGDTIVNEGDTIIQSGLTLDGTTGGADSGYAYQEYNETAQLYADDPAEAGDQEYWELESSSTVSRGLTVDIGLADNPSIIYDVVEDKWIANNGTGNGAAFPLKDVDAAISALVDSAPATLNTLDELASALGDDANFATSTSTALGNRVRVDSMQSLTAEQKLQARINIGAQEVGYYASSSHNHSGVYAPVSHNHSASNITSGTLSISRIPTGTSSTTVCKGNDSRLSNARTPTTHTHDDRYYTESEMDGKLTSQFIDFNDWYASYGNSSPSVLTYSSSTRLARLYSSDSTIGATYKAFRTHKNVIKYRVSLRAKSSSADSDGFYIGLFEYDSNLAEGKYAISNGASSSESSVVEDTRMKWLRGNASITSTLTTYEYTFTVSSTCKWFSIGFLNWSGMGTKSLYFDPSISIAPVVEPYSV